MTEHSIGITECLIPVNGIDVRARYSKNAVEGIFLPLLRRWTDMHRRKGKRILVMLAAPPGCGKTTLAAFLERLSRERDGIDPLQAIGMDGFHRRQEYLLTHTAERDGKNIPMVDIKGAPVTFDLPRLTESVRRAASGEKCGWPVYDRLLHNPAEDALTVDSPVVLLEGNYLLLDEKGWRDLAAFADDTVSVTAEEAFLRERLIRRRISTGVSPEAAVRFVDFSDMPNVRLCLEHSKPAETRLRVTESGDYRTE